MLLKIISLQCCKYKFRIFFGHTFTNFVKEFLSNTQVPEMVLNSVGIVLEKCISVSEAIKVEKCQNLFLLCSILPKDERNNLPNFALTSEGGFFQKVRFVFQISKSPNLQKKNIPKNYPIYCLSSGEFFGILFLKIWRFEKPITLSEKKTTLANIIHSNHMFV